MPTRPRNRQVSRKHESPRQKVFIIPRCTNSFSCTTTFAMLQTQKPRFWNFCRALTRPVRVWGTGTARNWRSTWQLESYLFLSPIELAPSVPNKPQFKKGIFSLGSESDGLRKRLRGMRNNSASLELE